MTLAEAPPAADLGPVSLGSLAASLPDRLDLRLAKPERSGEILTDPQLLGTLAEQMERVLSFACPGCRPSFRLESEPDTGDGLLIATVLTVDSKEGPGPISRAGKLGDERDAAGWNRVELEHLARMLISPDLLQVLGVRIRIAADSSGVAELSLRLPACVEWESPLLVSST